MSLLLTVTLRVTVWQEGAGGRERPGALPGAEVIGRAATAPPPPGPAAPPRQVKEQSSARPRAPARRGAGVNGRALARLPRRTRAPAPRAPSRAPAAPPACARARIQYTRSGGPPHWLSDSPNLKTSGGGRRGLGARTPAGGARRAALASPRQLWPDAGGRALALSRLRPGTGPAGATRRRPRADSLRVPVGPGLAERAAAQTFPRGRAQV